MTTWLLTGGAGYIGPHITRSFLASGRAVVVVDDLSNGFAENVPPGVAFHKGSILDEALLEKVIGEHGVDGVIHLAARKAVGESVAKPLEYYEHNVEGTRRVLTAMVRRGVPHVVFSSSAAVYGEQADDPITEDAPCRPTSPYGETKLVGEWLVRAASVAHGVRHVNLRYFNVAGAGAPQLGDRGVNNLIPLVFRALDEGRAPRVFGADYPTRDGSCIRDYIHVSDLAEAHLAAAAALERGEDTDVTLNVGTGTGTTVLEVTEAVRRATGIDVEPQIVGRRAGDVAVVMADAGRIGKVLGWRARLGLDEMVTSAWASWGNRHQV